MRLVQDEKVIEALTADRADQPLHEGVLPGRARGGNDLADPQGPDSPHKLVTVDCVSITKQEPRRRIVRERLDELPRRPDGGGVVGDVEVEEFAAIMAEHDEDEPETEGQGRHEEEVDGDDLPGVRGKKRPPRGRGPRGSPAHVLGDGPFGHVVAEMGEFRLDAPTAPGRIVPGDPMDQVANLRVELRTADRARLGLPSPIELEALAVPGEDGRGLHDDEAGAPVGPAAGQRHPEDSVPASESWPGDGALKDRELMAQGEVLERQVAVAADKERKEPEQVKD